MRYVAGVKVMNCYSEAIHYVYSRGESKSEALNNIQRKLQELGGVDMVAIEKPRVYEETGV